VPSTGYVVRVEASGRGFDPYMRGISKLGEDGKQVAWKPRFEHRATMEGGLVHVVVPEGVVDPGGVVVVAPWTSGAVVAGFNETVCLHVNLQTLEVHGTTVVVEPPFDGEVFLWRRMDVDGPVEKFYLSQSVRRPYERHSVLFISPECVADGDSSPFLDNLREFNRLFIRSTPQHLIVFCGRHEPRMAAVMSSGFKTASTGSAARCQGEYPRAAARSLGPVPLGRKTPKQTPATSATGEVGTCADCVRVQEGRRVAEHSVRAEAMRAATTVANINANMVGQGGRESKHDGAAGGISTTLARPVVAVRPAEVDVAAPVASGSGATGESSSTAAMWAAAIPPSPSHLANLVGDRGELHSAVASRSQRSRSRSAPPVGLTARVGKGTPDKEDAPVDEPEKGLELSSLELKKSASDRLHASSSMGNSVVSDGGAPRRSTRRRSQTKE